MYVSTATSCLQHSELTCPMALIQTGLQTAGGRAHDWDKYTRSYDGRKVTGYSSYKSL